MALTTTVTSFTTDDEFLFDVIPERFCLEDGLFSYWKVANSDILSSVVGVLYNLLSTKTFGNYKGGLVF